VNENLFALVKEEKRKKGMLDVPFYIAGAVILLMILTFLIIQPQPAGNRITYWIISITAFVALLIIIRFIAHYVFSKRIKKLQIQALLNSSSNDEEEKLKNFSAKQVDALYREIKRVSKEN